MTFKRCCTCHESREASEFCRDRTRKDGFHPRCKPCQKIWFARPEKAAMKRQNSRDFYAGRIEKEQERARQKYAATREARRAYAKQWAKDNPERSTRYCLEYQARLRQATPPWEDREMLRAIKAEINDMGLVVDHIHPLKGKNFCGLNVTWNLQALTLAENSRKHNRLVEECPANL